MKRVLFIAAVLSVFTAVCGQQIGSILAAETELSTARLHPVYKLPVGCFAYVGDEADTKTWKLPYLLVDGRPDLKRLPAAIEAVLTGYRGKKVSGISEHQLPDVLVRLGRAAAQAGKMPFQDSKAAAIYRQLQTSLEKLGLLDEIKGEGQGQG